MSAWVVMAESLVGRPCCRHSCCVALTASHGVLAQHTQACNDFDAKDADGQLANTSGQQLAQVRMTDDIFAVSLYVLEVRISAQNYERMVC